MHQPVERAPPIAQLTLHEIEVRFLGRVDSHHAHYTRAPRSGVPASADIVSLFVTGPLALNSDHLLPKTRDQGPGKVVLHQVSSRLSGWAESRA